MRDIKNDLLRSLSDHLQNKTLTETRSFKIESWAVKANILFMISLSLNVVAVFLAMLAKQWVSAGNRGLAMVPDPKRRALMRQYRHSGTFKYKLDNIIGILPTILHISIVCFGIG